MGRARSNLRHEMGCLVAELSRLQQAAHPRVTVSVAVAVTILLVLWGNGVVLLGRHLGASDAVALAAHPALAAVATVVLLHRGWRRDALGLTRPAPRPASRPLQVLLGILPVTAVLASAVVLSLDPSERLEILRLLLGTAVGEEVLHRSALLAVWTSTSVRPAVTTAVSMAAFGAWHLAGAFHGGAFHPVEVAVPALGTLVFLWARLRYRSVAAPIVLHVVTNLPGLVAGA